MVWSEDLVESSSAHTATLNSLRRLRRVLYHDSATPPYRRGTAKPSGFNGGGGPMARGRNNSRRAPPPRPWSWSQGAELPRQWLASLTPHNHDEEARDPSASRQGPISSFGEGPVRGRDNISRGTRERRCATVAVSHGYIDVATDRLICYLVVPTGRLASSSTSTVSPTVWA